MRARWIMPIALTIALSTVVAAFSWDYSQRIRSESRFTALEEKAIVGEKREERIDKSLERIELKIDRVQERLDQHMAKRF